MQSQSSRESAVGREASRRALGISRALRGAVSAATDTAAYALTRFLGMPEEINGDHRCPTYLWRWELLSTHWFKAYLHRFTGDDWCLDLHDHPRRFVSVGLFGSYLEHTKDGERRYRAPWVRSFAPEHAHRLTTPWGECWTLVIVLPLARDWGFWNAGRWIQWEEYVAGSSRHLADARKACP